MGIFFPRYYRAEEFNQTGAMVFLNIGEVKGFVVIWVYFPCGTCYIL
jgi:hypothetical protein